VLRALLAALRRYFSRRAARKLVAARLPRGLRAPLLPFPRARLPVLLALPPPLPSRVRDLGVADPRKFRLDPRTQSPANEGILPLESGDPSYRWVLPEFRRRYLDLPWMARDRIRFLGPIHAEWFLLWWDETVKEKVGARGPREWERPEDVDWAMDVCKEQMLIRRDVAKDEEAPREQEWSAPELGHPLVAWEPVPLPEMIPAKEWVEIADPRALLLAPAPERAARESYLQWRTLIEALRER
jgi:hypothetical protein